MPRLTEHMCLISRLSSAMMFTGVHIDPLSKLPVRWRVENSWVSHSELTRAEVQKHPSDWLTPLPYISQGAGSVQQGVRSSQPLPSGHRHNRKTAC